jgi:hypothetical protein
MAQKERDYEVRGPTKFDSEYQTELRKMGYKVDNKHFKHKLMEVLIESREKAFGRTGKHGLYSEKIIDENSPIIAGDMMESTKDCLNAVRIELEESKKVMQDIANQIKEICSITNPMIINQIKELRNYRMTVTSESIQLLRELKEIRQFFLDSEYKTEIDRLEKFLILCNELKKLKLDGTLDTICESIIGLALKEVKPK